VLTEHEYVDLWKAEAKGPAEFAKEFAALILPSRMRRRAGPETGAHAFLGHARYHHNKVGAALAADRACVRAPGFLAAAFRLGVARPARFADCFRARFVFALAVMLRPPFMSLCPSRNSLES
jgi:hypothetical protein